MNVGSPTENAIDAANRAILLKIDQKLKMYLQQTKHRDAATIAQRQGTPMPPALIDIWTDCRWQALDRERHVSARIVWQQFIFAKVIPRLGLYIKDLIPVDDILRSYMEDWEQEVADIHIDPADRAEIIRLRGQKVIEKIDNATAGAEENISEYAEVITDAA